MDPFLYKHKPKDSGRGDGGKKDDGKYWDKSTFKTVEDQKKAEEMSTTVYIGNINEETRDSQLLALMSKVGAVKRIIMGLHRVDKSPCGFAFAEYVTRESCERAILYLNGIILDKEPISVKIDPGFVDGRQYGRGRSGGQVRKEARMMSEENIRRRREFQEQSRQNYMMSNQSNAYGSSHSQGYPSSRGDSGFLGAARYDMARKEQLPMNKQYPPLPPMAMGYGEPQPLVGMYPQFPPNNGVVELGYSLQQPSSSRHGRYYDQQGYGQGQRYGGGGSGGGRGYNDSNDYDSNDRRRGGGGRSYNQERSYGNRQGYGSRRGEHMGYSMYNDAPGGSRESGDGYRSHRGHERRNRNRKRSQERNRSRSRSHSRGQRERGRNRSFEGEVDLFGRDLPR